MADLPPYIWSKIAKYLDPSLMAERLMHDAWVFGLVLALEIVILGLNKSSIKSLFSTAAGSARVDLLNFASYYAGFSLLIGLLLSLTLVSAILRGLQSVLHIDWTWLTDPFPVAVLGLAIVAFFLGDLLYYGYHRLMHSRWFWPLHRFHHAAEEFCTLTSIREHPVETAGSLIPYAIAIGLVGAPPESFALLFTSQRFISALHHSKFESDWGWAGRWMFVSPRMHALHHSNDPAHYDSNYGFVTPLWDRALGTYVADRHSVLTLGLTDGQKISTSWARGVAICYWEFVSSPVQALWRSLPGKAAKIPS